MTILRLGDAVEMAGWPYSAFPGSLGALFLVKSFVKLLLGSAPVILGLIILPATELGRRLELCTPMGVGGGVPGKEASPSRGSKVKARENKA